MNLLVFAMCITKRFSLLMLACFALLKASAFDDPPISYLGIEQGLSNNSVRCIYQDHKGFMWFGTYDGLSRFDGYEFKTFRNVINDSNSLHHNYIYAIGGDRNNNLWIGTGQGISIFNSLTSKFQSAYCYVYGTARKEKIAFNVNSIKADAKGNVFFTSLGWGLAVQFTGRDTAVQIPFRKGKKLENWYSARAITVDKKQRVWLMIDGAGLCVYDYKKREVSIVDTTIKTANCLDVDDKENVWIGTVRGLYKYSIGARAVVKTYTEQSGHLTSEKVFSLLFDKSNRLWIGTEGGGIDILNTVSGGFDHLLPGEHKNALSSESVYAIYEDKESRKWIGTLKGGINIIDPQKNRFQTVAHDPINRNSLVNNFASGFFEDDDRNLWIGTDGGGMSIWNRRKNTFTHFVHNPADPRSLSNNSVTCIKEDYLHNIWIGTFGGGVNRFNKATQSFEHFKCINEVTGVENKNVWLYEDSDKELWATTFANGRLYRFNRQLNRFETFNQETADLISIAEDNKGNLWAGNSHQLFKIDKRNKKFIAYEIGKPIRAIYEDKAGNFWLGTEVGGLILFNRQQGKIERRYSEAEGLCNNSILTIIEDNNGLLWLSTFNGLSKFDPQKNTFKNFYASDGLQSNQFLYRSALKLQSGELVFGGIRGFNIFFPDNITPRNYMPPLLLTGLRVNNNNVGVNNDYITNITAGGIQELKIPYNEAVLSFDFAALEFSSPAKITYAYLLDGWDKDWNYTTKIRTINYTSLNEGSYLLRIKSTNAEGEWNQKETTLKIIILPPWYRTWWAYTLYVLILLGVIYAYVYYKARDARLQYKVKLANLEKEKEKELNEKKLSFFTNISHEFRTPLTLIINPIKELLFNPAKDVEVNDLNIIYRNSRRLLSLVDQLLLFRKADTDKLKITSLNFYDLCQEVFLCFAQQAKTRNIRYAFICSNNELQLYADNEKIEIALFNLISNALKFTPDGGEISVEVIEETDAILIAIKDNGCGIDEAVGGKLFEKFYQAEQKQSEVKAGFGIGLYMVKSFIENHSGEISYESEIGKGTRFLVKLKKGKSHFSDDCDFEKTVANPEILKELAEAAIPEKEEHFAKTQETNLDTLVTDAPSILVVDDSEQIRQYLLKLFNGKYIVHEAVSGSQGLELVQKYMPDLVISDVVMDNGSGLELCQQIKQNQALSHIPVILLTGSSSSESHLKGIEGGADDYITKPFEKELLLARVTSILKSRNNLQKYFYNEITLQKNNLKVSPEYKEFLEKCIAIVESHLENEQFSIKTLASEIGMSHSNLYKKVKQISGQSVNSFIRFIRLRKAAELFINSDMNVNQTAFTVGINDIKYFREQFCKLFGMNPSDYIKKYRKAFGKSYKLNEKMTGP